MVAGIWAVFESLALAILAGTANAASGMRFGMAIWTIVLTIIAMYVAGRETSRLAGVVTRHNGLVHGMMMFGLSVVSAIVLAILAGALLAAGSIGIAGAHSSYVISAGAKWSAFITLLLGWLVAMGGASTGVRQDVVESRQSVQVRGAACGLGPICRSSRLVPRTSQLEGFVQGSQYRKLVLRQRGKTVF